MVDNAGTLTRNNPQSRDSGFAVPQFSARPHRVRFVDSLELMNRDTNSGDQFTVFSSPWDVGEESNPLVVRKAQFRLYVHWDQERYLTALEAEKLTLFRHNFRTLTNEYAPSYDISDALPELDVRGVATTEIAQGGAESAENGSPAENVAQSTSELVDAASSENQIIDSLVISGRHTIAADLKGLLQLIDEDPEESPVELDSLRAFAEFLIDEPQYPDPTVGSDPRGYIQAEWRVFENGLLVMNFRPNGLIRFVAVSAPAQLGVDRWRESDTLPKAAMLGRIGRFVQEF